MAKSILKNVFAKGILNVFNIVVPLLVIPYVYRVLNPSIIGNIEYATTLFSYFSLLGLLGIYNYGLREISRYRNKQGVVENISKNLFAIGIISNLFFFLLFEFFVYKFIDDVLLRNIMFVQGLGLIAQIFSVEWVNEAFEDFRFITIKTVIIRTISVIAIFVYVKNSSDYMIYVLITVLVLFVNNIVSLIYVKRNINLSIKKIFLNLNFKHYIVPLLFILVLNNTGVLYTIADRTMLGTYVGVESVAFYSIGQKVVEIIRVLLLSVVFVTLPRLSFYLEEDRVKYVQGVRMLVKLMLLIMLPASVGLFMLSEQIVLLFAGEQYLPAVGAMKIFALRIVILSIEAIFYNQIIFLHRKEKTLLCLNLLCGGVNILLNFLILNKLTPMSAITTTLFSEVLFQVLCLIYIRKKLQLSVGIFRIDNIKYILLSLLLIPVILFFKEVCVKSYLFVLSSILGCFVVYILGLLLLKDSLFSYVLNKIKK